MGTVEYESQVMSLLQYVTPLIKLYVQPGFDFDDLYQEAAFVVMRCLERDASRPVRYMKTFVNRSVRNRMIDLTRKSRLLVSLDAPTGERGIALADALLDARNPDPAMLSLAETVQHVAPIHREMLLSLAQGYDAHDIASAKHLTYDAAKMRVMRARLALCKVLAEEN